MPITVLSQVRADHVANLRVPRTIATDNAGSGSVAAAVESQRSGSTGVGVPTDPRRLTSS
jgi:hypothetical protein